jgi:hypothetical protein
VRDTVLPVALLAAALGMALSFSDRATARNAAIATLATAVIVTAIPFGAVPEPLAFTAMWLSIIAVAGSVHLAAIHRPAVFYGLAVNAGVWSGVITHVSGNSVALMVLPLVCLFLPGLYAVGRGWGVAIKVVCSWLIAIAALEIGLMFVPTPGYAPDHME